MIRRAAILTMIGLALLAGGCRKQPARGAAATSKPYVASSLREVYHRPTCEWAGKIADDNLLGYDSRQQAEADGKRPCKVCRP